MSILTADGALLTRDGKLLKSNGSGGGIYIPAPASAAVGQIVKVKAVDAEGKITQTEAVDMPGGDGIRTIAIAVLDGDTSVVTQSLDGQNVIGIQILSPSKTSELNATTAVISLTHQSGKTNAFRSWTLNKSIFSPKNEAWIIGNDRNRTMYAIAAESVAYSGTVSTGIEQGIPTSADAGTEDDPATGIRITFDAAPISGTVVKISGR